MKSFFSLIKNSAFIFVGLILLSACNKTQMQDISRVTTISENWKMQPEDKLKNIDEKSISEGTFNTTNWYDAVVPGETQTYHANFDLKNSGNKKPVLKVKA